VAGTGNGSVRLTTCFTALGDFSAIVDATPTDLSSDGELGLAVFYGGPDFADIFFDGPGAIKANLFVSPGFGTRRASVATPARLRIRRDGATLFLEYD